MNPGPFQTPPSSENGCPALLELRQATVEKKGARLLDGVSLQIREGEHTAILGPNGSGKSTLMKLITRQHYSLARQGDAPAVSIFGRDQWNVFELRSLLGIVSADLHFSFLNLPDWGRLTGMEAVLSGFFASHTLVQQPEPTLEMQASARRALQEVEGESLAGKWLDEMSTGEVRRILIARALAPAPRALLLDEPTSGLDLIARQRFLQTVRGIVDGGRTLILVTHHLEEIVPEIGRVILLKRGRVLADGPKHEMLTSGNLSAMFEHPVEILRQGDAFSAQPVL